jgi:hypothetical protein
LTKPVSSAPDYQRLLINLKNRVQEVLANEMPNFLQRLSRADARVTEAEVLGVSAPMDIVPAPIRVIDSVRRLLQFSAVYNVAFQFLARKSEMAVWSQCISLHLEQEWDETYVRVQTALRIKLSFHLIQRGDEMENFSATIDPYLAAYEGTSPVAVRLHQREIHAPQYVSTGRVVCDSCGAQFGLGVHQLYPANNQAELVLNFEQILAADHAAGRPHLNLYELVGRLS